MNIVPADRERGYSSIVKVLSNREYAHQLLETALAEFQALRNKYAILVELAELFDVIDELQTKYSNEPAFPPVRIANSHDPMSPGKCQILRLTGTGMRKKMDVNVNQSRTVTSVRLWLCDIQWMQELRGYPMPAPGAAPQPREFGFGSECQ